MGGCECRNAQKENEINISVSVKNGKSQPEDSDIELQQNYDSTGKQNNEVSSQRNIRKQERREQYFLLVQQSDKAVVSQISQSSDQAAKLLQMQDDQKLQDRDLLFELQEFNHELISSIIEDISLMKYSLLCVQDTFPQERVIDVFDELERKFLALKFFSDSEEARQDYLYEKKMMIYLHNLGSSISDLYNDLKGYNDRSLMIVYEQGACTLQQLIEYKQMKNTPWNEQDLIHVFYVLLDFSQRLFKKDVFYSDWKPSKIAIFQNERSLELSIKLIDFCRASVDFKVVHQFTEFFAQEGVKQMKFLHKLERLAYENYQIGRIMQILLMNSQIFSQNLTEESKQLWISNKLSQIVLLQKESIDEFFIHAIQGKCPTAIVEALKLCLLSKNDSDIINTYESAFERCLNNLRVQVSCSESKNNNKAMAPTGFISSENQVYVKIIKTFRLHSQYQMRKYDIQYLEKEISDYQKLKMPFIGFRSAVKALDIYNKQIEKQLSWNQYNNDHYKDKHQQLIKMIIQALQFAEDMKFPSYTVVWAEKLQLLDQVIDLKQEQQVAIQMLYGKIYQEQGCLEKAEELYQAVIKTMVKTFRDANHPKLAELYYLMGTLLQQRQKLEDAEIQLIKAHQIQKKEYGEDHLSLIKIINSLGNLYLDQGKPQDAEVKYKRVIQIKLKNFKGDHPDLAESYIDLGIAQRQQNKLAEAEAQFIKALDIDMQFHGEYYYNSINKMNNLGLVLRQQKKFNDAEQLLLKAIKLQNLLFHQDSLQLAEILQNLGAVYLDVGNLQEAQQQYSKSLWMFQGIFGKDYAGLAPTTSKLGLIYYQLGKLEDAQHQFTKAINLYRKVKDDASNPEIVSLFTYIGNICFDLNKYDEANTFYQQTIELIKKQSLEVNQQASEAQLSELKIKMNQVQLKLAGSTKSNEKQNSPE